MVISYKLYCAALLVISNQKVKLMEPLNVFRRNCNCKHSFNKLRRRKNYAQSISLWVAFGKGRVRVPKRINFLKLSKCGHCQSENLYCRVWTFFWTFSEKKCNIIFWKQSGGGMSKAIWNFSENLSVLVPWPVSLYSLVTIGYLETRGLQQQILSQPEYLIFDWFLNTEDHLY